MVATMRCPEKFDRFLALGKVQCTLTWGHENSHQWSGQGALVSWQNEHITAPEDTSIERVRAARADLDQRRARLQYEQDKLQADVRLLQQMCAHPRTIATSHMGESCRDCPDCGACLA